MHSVIKAAGLMMLVAVATSSLCPAEELERRRFVFTYSCSLEAVPEGATTIDLWMPVPVDTQGQQVHRVEIVHPTDGQIDVEPRYGNRIFHKRFTAPFDGDAPISAELQFDVEREEIVVPAAKSLASVPAGQPSAELDPYLEPNRLIPIDGKVAEITAALKLPAAAPLTAARQVYDHLIATMQYNWRAEGAGRGDVLWACDSRTGDCTDYHSTFLAICRAHGTPADHEFGFPLPKDRSEGPLPYYHCWARFWVPEAGWIPVDISEADKHPELLEYNFGSLTPHLLKLSHGRDVTLVPPQQGEPLNIFVHPYVEIDGQPHKEHLKWKASFVDVERS